MTAAGTTRPRGSSRLAIIQHHPRRAELLPRLVERLEGFRVEIVESERRNPPDPWHTYSRCLELGCELACDGFEHVTILQDDAIVCDDFAGELDRCIADRPDDVLVLFLASQPADTAERARHARSRGERWAPLMLRDRRTWMPVVGVTYPMSAVADVLDWIDGYERRISRSDDHMLGQWATDPLTKHAIVCAVPSLVNHPDDVYSCVGNGAPAHGHNRARTALYFPP